MPRSVWPIVASHWSSPAFYRGLAAHLQAVPRSVQQMRAPKRFTTCPVCLLTPHTADPLSPHELARIGPTTRQIIVEDCGHWVHLDQPSLVVEAIRTMVEEYRTKQRLAEPGSRLDEDYADLKAQHPSPAAGMREKGALSSTSVSTTLHQSSP